MQFWGSWCAYPNLCLSGKLDKGAVLKAICAGFRETTEPAVCLSEGWCINFNRFLSVCSFMIKIYTASLTCLGLAFSICSFMLLRIVDIQTNECLENNGGCWQDKAANISACKVFLMVLSSSETFPSGYAYHTWLCTCRTLFVEEFVNVQL